MSFRLSLPSAALGVAVTGALALAISGRSRRESVLGPADPPRGLPPARTVVLPGRGELFLRDQPGPADAPPICLVHGWVATADLNWFTSYRHLAPLGRVIAPDHRGHGRGTRPSQPFRLVDVADDIAELLRVEGAAPAIIVGYSMGGAIAQLIWRRHPDVVAGLVLSATAAHFRFSPLAVLGLRLMGPYQLGSRLLPRSWVEWVLLAQARGVLPKWLATSTGEDVATSTPLLPWAVGEVLRGDTEDIAEAGRELSRFDSREWIGDVDVPTAVLATTRDRLVLPAAQRRLIDLLGDPHVGEVRGDHDAPAAAASEFNAALVEAIRSVADRLPAVSRG